MSFNPFLKQKFDKETQTENPKENQENPAVRGEGSKNYTDTRDEVDNDDIDFEDSRLSSDSLIQHLIEGDSDRPLIIVPDLKYVKESEDAVLSTHREFLPKRLSEGAKLKHVEERIRKYNTEVKEIPKLFDPSNPQLYEMSESSTLSDDSKTLRKSMFYMDENGSSLESDRRDSSLNSSINPSHKTEFPVERELLTPFKIPTRITIATEEDEAKYRAFKARQKMKNHNNLNKEDQSPH